MPVINNCRTGGRRRNLLLMNCTRRQLLLLLAAIVVTELNSVATTCVAPGTLSVRQVCGVVVAMDNTPIAQAEVELLDAHSDVLQRLHTNQDGTFKFAGVAKGQYILRVKCPGFAWAVQPLFLSNRNPQNHCKKPMRVRLRPGSCSSVSLGGAR